jgi:hypothetical protein
MACIYGGFTSVVESPSSDPYSVPDIGEEDMYTLPTLVDNRVQGVVLW